MQRVTASLRCFHVCLVWMRSKLAALGLVSVCQKLNRLCASASDWLDYGTVNGRTFGTNLLIPPISKSGFITVRIAVSTPLNAHSPAHTASEDVLLRRA